MRCVVGVSRPIEGCMIVSAILIQLVEVSRSDFPELTTRAFERRQ
jgi:hypothetical protein